MLLREIQLVMKTSDTKENSANKYFHNILRLFNVLTNFPFTRSETIRDYY